MTKKYRRYLFYFSLMIFVFAGCVLVVYALGYKFDFVGNKLVKTGSVAMRVNVSADVYINDELAGNTSFLGNNFNRGFLLPRNYLVRVQNTDYQSWQKSVDISAGMLADFPDIILIPKEFVSATIASSSFSYFSKITFNDENKTVTLNQGTKTETIDLKNGKLIRPNPTPFVSITPTPSPTPSVRTAPVEIKGDKKSLVSPDKKKAVWFTSHEIWVQWLEDSNRQPFQKAGDVKLITRYSQNIDDVQWFRDSAHIFVSAGKILRFVEIDIRGGINLNEISAINSPFLYVLEDNAIYMVEGKEIIKTKLFK